MSSKGLTLDVLRNGRYDCTNGGASANVRQITVINLGKDAEIFDATSDSPAFRLECHTPGCLRLVPVGDPREKTSIGPMFGGNYAATSDSRFSEACEKLLGYRFYGAVAIHDRFETQRQYDVLSR